jgi:hypothetical protein
LGLWEEAVGIETIHSSNEYLHLTGVSSGINYRLKVRAKNKHGWGPYSDELIVLAAVEPSQPPNTQSSHNGLAVLLSWDLPSENGAAVD